MRVKVTITPRSDVLDPQGKAVLGGLRSLGYSEVGEVRVGRHVEMAVDAKEPAAVECRVREMCERLLANPIIEDFSFTVEE